MVTPSFAPSARVALTIAVAKGVWPVWNDRKPRATSLALLALVPAGGLRLPAGDPPLLVPQAARSTGAIVPAAAREGTEKRLPVLRIAVRGRADIMMFSPSSWFLEGSTALSHTGGWENFQVR